MLISFIPFTLLGFTANIMSLGGIAIAIGAMDDAAIVVVEQTHKKLEDWEKKGRPGLYQDVVVSAIKEVGAPSFFALLVIAVAFLPILTLEAQEGRLFKPLAYTKNLSMLVAAVLAITLDPALRVSLMHVRRLELRPRWLARAANAVLIGRIRPEEEHPVSRPLMRAYEPVVTWALIAANVAVFLYEIRLGPSALNSFINTWGLVPARLMADVLGVEEVGVVGMKFYKGTHRIGEFPRITQELTADLSGKKILLVDDVADTGRSLIVAKEYLKRKGAELVKVATIHYKPNSEFKPDFFVMTASSWIAYPWERHEIERELGKL